MIESSNLRICYARRAVTDYYPAGPMTMAQVRAFGQLSVLEQLGATTINVRYGEGYSRRDCARAALFQIPIRSPAPAGQARLAKRVNLAP
jgi:hypothetical protein